MNIGIRVLKPSFQIMTPEDEIKRMPQLIERFGRISHKSEDKITDESAAKFIKRIAIKLGHESIMEHCSITVCFVMSRAASHQIVRHRLAAYTQESQRYCDYSAEDEDTKVLNVILPPSIAGEKTIPSGLVISYDASTGRYDNAFDIDPDIPLHIWIEEMVSSYEAYLMLREKDIPAEDARFVLPNASKTEIYATYNLRTWRHVFKMRCDSHAQWEIRGLMLGVFNKFKSLLPCIFDDQVFG